MSQADIAGGTLTSEGEVPLKGRRLREFALMSSEGTPVRLSDYRGRSNLIVVLTDQRPEARQLLAELRIHYEEIRNEGAQVLAIKSASHDQTKRTRERLNLPFQGYRAIAELEGSRNNLAAAKQMYQKALEIDPNSPMANNNLAYMMIDHDDNLDQAISTAQAARRRAPENPNIADTLGYAYIKKRVYNSAIDLLEGASKKDPNSASVHYHLGLAYQKLNNSSKAREQFQKAAQLSPQSAEGLAAKKELQKSRPRLIAGWLLH